MQRRSKFIIGLSSALLTFGVLMATIGPRHFQHHRDRHGACHGHDRACCQPTDSLKMEER